LKRFALAIALTLAFSHSQADTKVTSGKQTRNPSESVDITPDYSAVIGTGQFSCGKFVEYQEAKNSAQLDLIVQWTWGFLTAYNTRGNFGPTWKRVKHVNNMPDSASVILYLDSYCRKYPMDSVLNGVFSIIKDIGGEIVGAK
jgi:hypothetical protein